MNKALFFQVGSLGDAFLIFPAIKAVKKKYPHCKTIVMLSPASKDIFEYNRYVDEIVYVKKTDASLSLLKKLWRADLALFFSPNWRPRLIAWLARVRIRAAIDLKSGLFLTHQLKDIGDKNNIYEAATNLKLTKSLGFDTSDLRLEIPPCRNDEKVTVDKLLQQYVFPDADKFIIIAPYSSNRLKNWPEKYYNEVIDYFHSIGYALLLLGGKEIKANAAVFPNAIYIPAIFNPRQSTYIISLAKLIICGCSFPLHLASTTSTPSVAIYGPTTPERWAPYANCSIIRHDMPCSPCIYHAAECHNNNRCLKDIKSAEVISIARRILADAGQRVHC